MLFDEITAVLDPEPHHAALNMAIDEVLFHRATGPLLRVYHWALPAISFGYFEKADAVRRAWPERELVRRWTGGGVVSHGEDFTYTLIVPRGGEFWKMSLGESYRAIHEAIAGVLSVAGISAEVAGATAPKISSACFENPVRHDLTDGVRKIAGAAQRRTRAGLLHQGSIRVAGVNHELSAKLPLAFASKVLSRGIQPEEIAAAQQLAQWKYETSAWMERGS